jgi:hypothetical protein
MTPQNAKRLQRVRKAVARLPARERPLWTKRIDARLRAQAALPAVGADAEDPPLQFREWDLELANWLDRVYGTVSDRATEVRKDAFAATSELGQSLFPLAAVAVALALFLYVAKRPSSSGGYDG